MACTRIIAATCAECGINSFSTAEKHLLPAPLVVSLTSYPPRFSTLYGTLTRLLFQSVRPDHVILWIAGEDISRLPRRVYWLTYFGLEIRITSDTGPYKKIIPALHAFPGAFIVTADDDINYRSRWLEGLISEWDGRSEQIVFHRGHEVVLDAAGSPVPYAAWKFCVEGPREAKNLLPTGAGGVLYPPGSLAPQVTDETSFMVLCPRGDDLWLYWMGRLAGASYKKTSMNDNVVNAPDSQQVALWHDNLTGGLNDVYIANLIKKYNWPT